MEKLVKIKFWVISLVSLFAITISCSSTDEVVDGEIPSEEEVVDVFSKMCMKWGTPKEEILKNTKGMKIVENESDAATENSDEEIVKLQGKKTSVMLAYKFIKGKLCTSLVMAPKVDLNIENVLTQFKYVGMLANKDVYANSSENICAISYHVENEEDSLLVIGCQPLLTITELVDGKPCADLGLSVKWATYNSGAKSPEEYGSYYAWGETDEKDIYNSSTYKFNDGTSQNMIDIGDDIAGTQYDVARMSHGISYSMPTNDEMSELLTKCSWIWTSEGQSKGYKVFGKNGNYIFLPAGGEKTTKLSYLNVNGYYFTSNIKENLPRYAYVLSFTSSKRRTVNYLRYRSGNVRPVVKSATY